MNLVTVPFLNTFLPESNWDLSVLLKELKLYEPHNETTGDILFFFKLASFYSNYTLTWMPQLPPSVLVAKIAKKTKQNKV